LRIRIGAAEGYMVDEMMSFDDASGVAPEESIGTTPLSSRRRNSP
jgi:hypothetical protein